MSHPASQAVLRRLPKMDRLLSLPGVEELSRVQGRQRVAGVLREMLEELRREVAAGRAPGDRVKKWNEGLLDALRFRLEADLQSLLMPVINATGVLIHTNLGRAPLSREAISRMTAVAEGYSTLEYDLERGERGSRSVHARRLLDRLFPGAASHVVNNNAAAVLLALNTLAEGREVVVSRGELVEIGGSFRIPDVMRKGQAVLREVGTTNRTRLSDYEEALGPETGLLLKVHTSNYRIVGFTAEVSLEELAALGKSRNLPVMVDQGSGSLDEPRGRAMAGEVPVRRLLEQGADLVTFSGDKLLGGPQAGILIGRPDLLERIRKNPLSRALRADKITFAALEATLAAHLTGRQDRDLPVLRMLSETAESVASRARRCAVAVEKLSRGAVECEVKAGSSVVGGGAAPAAEIPSSLLIIRCGRRTPDSLEESLRRGRPPVIARIESDSLVLDLRTVPEEWEEDLAKALAALARGNGES